MLFAHSYLKYGQKLEAWIISPDSREYFKVKPAIFFSTI